MFGWITWDRVGPLGGKCRTISWEGRGVVLASWHLQGCSPSLCWLSTDGLTPASKYWTYRLHAGDMGPVSLVVYHQQKLGLSLLLHWLVWERNWVRTHGSVSRRAVDYVESPFSWEQWDPSKYVDDSWKVATYDDYPREAYVGRTWTGMGSVRVVLIRFSPAWCTSIRIAMTIGYE
jgi:hypothetical protein